MSGLVVERRLGDAPYASYRKTSLVHNQLPAARPATAPVSMLGGSRLKGHRRPYSRGTNNMMTMMMVPMMMM
eukprot:6844500-Pyramimonas_sp.AAC.2